MAFPGEVSYTVKRAITFHQRFTVAQLADATGLEYEQVEQVVQRLKRKGFVRRLVASELHEAEKTYAQKVGRPRQLYALTDDEGRRSELFAAVEAMESAVRLSGAKERTPSTVYYEAALKIVDAMETRQQPVSSSRLDEAAALLAYGREYEAMVPEGAEIAQAHYDVAQARVEALRAAHQAAEHLLTSARECFEQAGLAREAGAIDEFMLSMRVARHLATVERASDLRASVRALEEALDLLSATGMAHAPLVMLLGQALEMILANLPANVVKNIADQIVSDAGRGIREELAKSLIPFNSHSYFRANPSGSEPR